MYVNVCVLFEILHTVTSLCLEKCDIAQFFLKKNLESQNGSLLS